MVLDEVQKIVSDSMDENFVIKTNGHYMWIKADREY